MPTIIVHPSVDVVIMGQGMFGGSLAAQLSTAGYKTVGIERGPYWDFTTDFAVTSIHDEYENQVTKKFDYPLYLGPVTYRNTKDQMALPNRQYNAVGQSNPYGYGVGGLSTHWASGCGRQGPWAYRALSSTISRYGEPVAAGLLPSDHDVEDWPWTYDQIVPYYEAWEKEVGVSGLNQDPYTPNATFPTPPHPLTPLGSLFHDSTLAMGLNPYPSVSGITPIPYVNTFGISRAGCVHCGFCYHCETAAKYGGHNATVPAAIKTGNHTLVTGGYIFRIDTDPATGMATAVRYYDLLGNVHVQPGKVIFCSLWGSWSMRMLLLSGIGRPYNPATATGSLGRGLATGNGPSTSSSSGLIPSLGGNNYGGATNSGGMVIGDYQDDNVDHTGLNFFGGAYIKVGDYPRSSPGHLSAARPGRTNFGSAWKAGLKDMDLVAVGSMRVSISAGTADIPTKANYMDLDPHYVDAYGDPLARQTYEFTANDWRVATHFLPQIDAILAKMGATGITDTKIPEFSEHELGKSGNHMKGGFKMGASQATSVFNKWMQCWDVQNLFGAGEDTIPFGTGASPGSHIASTNVYLAGEGIKKYLQSPGPLV